ncbi:unnamed protein product, partial [Staurois parvus]
MGPLTDPGPSGSARVSKWSLRPCTQPLMSKPLATKVSTPLSEDVKIGIMLCFSMSQYMLAIMVPSMSVPGPTRHI